MKCPQCHHENREEARYCNSCGRSLDLTCASCAHGNAPGSRFCSRCGNSLNGSGAAASTTRFASPGTYTPKHLAEKILISKHALEGERKQVTVLFADLKGSMELLADRDPEEARELLDPVLERMIEAVHRYEGTVNQVMGDGIMALFGAPLAHEDHAVRACYAALRMQEQVKRYAEEARHAHGVNVQIRVGLNSGEVVVRTIGSDLHMDYTAVGQTTHLAARIEQFATPGTILLTASTLDLVEGQVAVTPLGPVPVKGLAGPVEVYEVTGAGPARTRLQAAARRGLTRFVGRVAELDQLLHAQQLAGGGRGQVMAVVGEAGVGKSRLFFEFKQSHRLQGWLVLESASVSYGKTTSYLPVVSLLKDYFKIQDRDDHREIREKVTGKLLTLDEALKPTLPALLALLDAPLDDTAWRTLDPMQRRQQTLDALKRLLLRESREQALLLIFEDLHGIDSETQALLDSLVESLGSARLLLLANYRPEYQHTWGSKTFYSQLRLDALRAESAGELLDALLGDDPGLTPLKHVLVKRGNPFFLEETVRTLVETKALAGEPGRFRLLQPVQTIQTPHTVQVMLAARIDRLSPEDKRLLQVASVVGKDVPWTLLHSVAGLPDDALRLGLERLQAAEFLYETGLFPDLEYAFKHALTQEVTYGGLLQDRRRELHARIVDGIERLYADRLGEQIERLAHHAVQGDLRERAVRYLRQAGLKAAALSALQDARSWFEQALVALDALPESQPVLEQAFEIRLELRPMLAVLGDVQPALERLREALALADRLNDERRRGRVCAFMTSTHSLLGQLDEALATGTRALAIAGDLGDIALHVATMIYLAQVHYYRGEYERVVELATDNLAALRAARIPEEPENTAPTSIYDLCWLALSLAELGRFAEAAVHEEEALRLAEPARHAFHFGWAHSAAGSVHLLKGDLARARILTERGVETLRAGNIVLLLPWAVAFSAWVLAELGEAALAQARLGEGEQLLERHSARGIAAHSGWAYLSLSRASLLLGRLDDAHRLAGRAAESSERHPGFTAHALHLQGDLSMHQDRFDAGRGETCYREALALAESHGMRPLVAHCYLGLSKLYRSAGRLREAQELFARATTMYREMDMQFWLERAQA